MRVLLLLLLISISEATLGKGGQVPVGVTFHNDTLYRSDARGDNWCITWAADDSQVTSMCDGNWLNSKQSYHNHLYRIVGGPDNFQREDISGYPQFVRGTGSWFGYGIVSVDGNIYSVVSKTPANRWSGPFRGIKLLKSPDNGKTWHRVDRNGDERKIGPSDDSRNEVNSSEMFLLEEFGLPHQKKEAYPFSYVDFVKHGKDNSAAKDDYLYIYSPEGAYAHKLLLARVNKEKLGIRSDWEYFQKYQDNRPVWTTDIRKRGYVHIFPEKSKDGNYFGWYSWLPSVVWNKGLGLYIMVNGGTYAGHGMTNSDKDYYDAWMHTRTGSLGFWYSDNPYGPWHRFFYTDYWTADNPANLTYQPKLSPKWISEDGSRMVLIWSDAMKNSSGKSHTVNYKWNQMKITIQTTAPAMKVSFEPPKDIAGGNVSGISSMDAGDIDGDNLVDVVIVEGGKHAGGRKTFSWLKAPKDTQDDWRRFDINPDAPLRLFLGAAKLADMDKDGDLDLVVSSDNHSGGKKETDILVFINPKPKIQPENVWKWHKVNDKSLPYHHINDMEIEDMDSDGKPDIVVRSLEPNQIHIFFQNSISSYTKKTINTGIDRSEGLAVGHIDSDEYADISYTGYWLQSPSNPRTENYTKRPIDIEYKNVNQNTKEAVGDIDGDGRLDVVIAPAEAFRNGGDHDLAWYRNPGGNYDVPWKKTVIEAETNNHHTVKLGDIDNDNDLDVVIGVPWDPKCVRIYYNDGSGSFGNVQTVCDGKGLYSGVLADLGNDGDLDIIGQDTYARESKPWVYENLTTD